MKSNGITPTVTISVEDYNKLVLAAKQETYNVERLVNWIYDYAYRNIDKDYILNALYSTKNRDLGHLIKCFNL